MAAYSYICVVCGHTMVVRAPMSEGPPEEVFCPAHDNRDTFYAMKRDYAADGVGLGNVTELRQSRESGGTAAMRDQFLPTAKELAHEGDPDGSKGINDWNERFSPRSDNKRPARPVSPKRLF